MYYVNFYFDYPLAAGKIEIKRQMLSSYHSKIDDFYNISVSTVKQLVPRFSDNEKHVLKKFIVYYNSVNHNGSNRMLNVIHKKEKKDKRWRQK